VVPVAGIRSKIEFCQKKRATRRETLRETRYYGFNDRGKILIQLGNGHRPASPDARPAASLPWSSTEVALLCLGLGARFAVPRPDSVNHVDLGTSDSVALSRRNVQPGGDARTPGGGTGISLVRSAGADETSLKAGIPTRGLSRLALGNASGFRQVAGSQTIPEDCLFSKPSIRELRK
jgi:hypothetical protein